MFAKPSIIGLDIGSNSIKMVEISHEKNQRVLMTYGFSKHDFVLDGYWDSSKLRQVGTLIEEIYNSAGFSAIKTVVGVQSKDVYVTSMDFELSWNKKMIQEEIDKQAPYFLPYPPDDMRMSWSLIKNDPRIQSFTGKQRVIINALPDFVIENSKNLLEHINLDGAALENQTISQIRATLDPDQGNTILVDIGSHHTTYSIIVDGVLRSSSHVPIGVAQITDALKTSLGLDEETAEMFKNDLNLVNLFTVPDEVTNTLTIIKSELQSFVELNKNVAQTPAKIVITGGGLYTPSFLEFFRNFPVPVFAANCTRNIVITPEFRPFVQPYLNQLSTSIGLAMRTDI